MSMNVGYVSVRTLCEFTARTGDLDLRFTPAPSAAQGKLAHQIIQTKRGNDYEAEVALQGEIAGMYLRGRADGFNTRTQCLEEIKSHLGPVKRIKENHRALHWAQAKVYGALLCAARGLSTLRVAVVYVNAQTHKEAREAQDFSVQELEAFAAGLVQAYRAWHEQEQAHRQERDAYLLDLAFPYGSMRDGQRVMARAVYWSIQSSDAQNAHQLLAQAPTGTGKTLASLYGALRAMPVAKTDRVFYLTPKSSGKALAWQAVDQLFNPGEPAKVRVIELVAKEKACEHPQAACHPDSCPLAAGFFDRLPEARRAAVALPLLTPVTIRQTALAHSICPYYLTQALAAYSDVVIGDYNYYFDRSALLYALAQELEWNAAVLLDEAHSLLERARGMYGAGLKHAYWRGFAKHAPSSLARKARVWLKHWQAMEQEVLPQRQARHYTRASDLPDNWFESALGLNDALARYLNDHASELLPKLRDAQYQLGQFLGLVSESQNLAEQGFFGVQTVEGEIEEIEWVCVSPAMALAERIRACSQTKGQALILFSATLGPPEGIVPLLGLAPACTRLTLESPFDPANLEVNWHVEFSTRHADRQRSAQGIASLITASLEKSPGNYLAFFNSFAHLEQVRGLLPADVAATVLVQQSGMQEADQQAFIDTFRTQQSVLGLAVLGGRFSEGIDLPGASLVGVFIAGLGYAALDERNKLIAEQIDRLIGQGFERHFLYPAMQRVVQAAGRVIRTETDKGSVWLLDDRFMEPRVRRLLPEHWRS